MPKNFGFLVPRPSKCTDCKGGTKGMDVCDKCAGTGTIFRVGSKTWPDTREGYSEAEKALNSASYVPMTHDDPLRDLMAYRLADYL